ncbi:MAG: hypothetical protein H7Y17_00955 [Chlorobia bacterium]|nr:hypothetical protein [Fimbriimonadaceae bacterium]
MKKLGLIATIALAFVATSALAQNGQIRSINAFPTMSVADARSTVTITALVVNSKGNPVADGTQVTFSSTLGSFRSELVTTQGGRAQAILVAGGVPGTAIITVRTPGAAPTNYEFEFLSDRALLSSAKEYVEIVAPGYMTFSMDEKIIGAAGLNHGVHIRYRDVEIDADDMQLNIPTYEMRLKKAKIKFGDLDQEFDECYIKLNQRKGYGVTTFIAPTPVGFKGFGNAFQIVNEDKPRYGLVEFNSNGVKPYNKKISSTAFEFTDLSESLSMVSAKKAVVFPRKEVQFQKAEVLIGGVKVMKLPLYSVSLMSGSALVTDQIVNVNDNQLAIDYPYYLSLKPGETSAVRLRTGQRYGRGSTASRGVFLDYEMSWNKGDDMDGGLTVSSIARKDWSIGVRQFYRFDSRSTASAFLEMPAGRNLFGNLNYNRQLDGWNLSFYGNASQALTGSKFQSQSYSMALERDPMKVGKLPIKLFYGITADHKTATTTLGNSAQSGYGVRVRSQLNPTRIDNYSTLNASFAVSQLEGRNVAQGLTLLGSASLSRQLGNAASMVATYDYSQDPFSSQLLGSHRLSLQAFYNSGRTGFTFFGTKSLDLDRYSYYADMNYRVSGLWRLMGSYTFDKYLNDSYLDYNATIAYRLGIRELGLTWSYRTKRFGIQVFGATLN